MPDFLSAQFVHHLIAAWGYWAVLLFVGVESAGLPLPGETALVSAAIYAGTTHNLNIALVVLFATIGAVLGDNVGYLIGRRFGYPLLLRHGPRIGINTARFKLGRYLFLRHGGKVVFFGRFVAALRVLAALLAGATKMPWRRFLLFNALGGAAWAALFGFGGFALGSAMRRAAGPIGIGALILVVIGIVAGFLFLRHNEARLEAQALRAFPDPETVEPGAPEPESLEPVS